MDWSWIQIDWDWIPAWLSSIPKSWVHWKPTDLAKKWIESGEITVQSRCRYRTFWRLFDPLKNQKKRTSRVTRAATTWRASTTSPKPHWSASTPTTTMQRSSSRPTASTMPPSPSICHPFRHDPSKITTLSNRKFHFFLHPPSINWLHFEWKPVDFSFSYYMVFYVIVICNYIIT